MNAYGRNLVLLALIIIIAITALSISTSASVPKELYPLAVFVIAVALLYHASLISLYVWGWDIQRELYSANAVLDKCEWNVHVLANQCCAERYAWSLRPTSIVSGVSVEWDLQTYLIPLFALVPVSLFVVFQKQDERQNGPRLLPSSISFVHVLHRNAVTRARKIAEAFSCAALLTLAGGRQTRWLRQGNCC